VPCKLLHHRHVGSYWQRILLVRNANFIQHDENLFVLWIPREWLHITSIPSCLSIPDYTMSLLLTDWRTWPLHDKNRIQSQTHPKPDYSWFCCCGAYRNIPQCFSCQIYEYNLRNADMKLNLPKTEYLAQVTELPNYGTIYQVPIFATKVYLTFF
jgi:hypothetical protein